MVFSVSPAVTIREIDLTSNVPAVASNQGAIAGVFAWGPVGEVTQVTSEDDLVNIFGKPTNDNYETFFTAADYLAYSNQLYVVRAEGGAVKATASVVSGNSAPQEFEARYPGSLGNSIGISFVSGEEEYSQQLFTVGEAVGDPADNIFNTSGFAFTANTDITGDLRVGDTLQVGNDSVGFQNLVVKAVDVQPIANTATFATTISFENRFTLAAQTVDELQMNRAWAFAHLVEKAPEAGKLHIVVYDVDGKASGVAGSVLERYIDLALIDGGVSADGVPNYYRNVINEASAWVRIPATTADIAANTIGYLALAGGTNGSTETSVAFGALAKAYDAFKNTEELDLAFILQGKAHGGANLANYILSNVVEARNDVMLFLSPSRDTVLSGNNVLGSRNEIVTNMIAFRNQVQSSSFWVMDTGYKYRFDKYNNVFRWVPMNGDIAGLTARVEPWESPAGQKRGNIKNVAKLAFNPNKAERDRLYGADINSVISQVGQGVVLWGDKTGLGRSSAFDRINVRRLFTVVEKVVATVSSGILFDFNDEFTQTEFRNTIEPYLRDIKGRRGITDFIVVCDSRVNTPDVIDKNTFRANIFIKPARSISFIELTFVATRTGISFEELVGQQF
jgi:hypothetical protein